MADNANSRFQEGIRLQNSGQLTEARAIYQVLARELPNESPIHVRLGQVSFALNEMHDAARHFADALRCNPDQPDILANLGVAYRRLGQFEEALACQKKALKLNPNHAGANNNLGILLFEVFQKPEEALEAYNQALKLDPGNPDLWSNRGNVLQALARFDAAEESLRKAIALDPERASAHFNLGNLLMALERFKEAVASYQQAIALRPHYAESFCNLGAAFKNLDQPDEAMACYEEAINLNPQYPDAHFNLGNLLSLKGRLIAACECYARCLEAKPDHEGALGNYGDALTKLRRYEDAAVFYDRAVQLCPDKHTVYVSRGNLYNITKDYVPALTYYERALSIEPDIEFMHGQYLHTKLYVGDWRNYDQLVEDLIRDISAGKTVSAPFPVLTMSDEPAVQKLVTETFTSKKFPPVSALLWPKTFKDHARIRIGYFSSDYCHHPVTHLMLGLFAAHDRSRFEVIAFSFGNPIKDHWHQRVRETVDQFVDVNDLSDREIAELARSKEIDIAVDLNGFTEHCRAGIFAHRAAPVQVSYIGYLGTMAAPYIDYLVTDETIVPAEARPFYTEKMIYLPTYQCNDPHQQPSDRAMTRAEFGLPDDAFVFCAFNNNYKITPPVFESWMRILQRVPNGVLWLYVSNEKAQEHLREFAKQHGVSPDRLVFAKKIPLEDHLARQRLGDLFLDTLPYNAGATASNALRVGLPVLTRTGKSFAGRMGSSLLKSVGLPELITATVEAYENRAVELANNPQLMQAIRNKLAQNLPNSPLFDNNAFARNIESAFATIHQRACQGLKPMHVLVK